MVHRPVQSVRLDNRDRKDHPVHRVPMVKLVALVHLAVLVTRENLDLMDNLEHLVNRAHKDNQDHRAVATIAHHRAPDLDSPQNTNNYLYSYYSLEDTHYTFAVILSTEYISYCKFGDGKIIYIHTESWNGRR